MTLKLTEPGSVTISRREACGICRNGNGLELHRHAMQFATTKELREHLVDNVASTSSERGKPFDEWLGDFLAWHAAKVAERAKIRGGDR